MAFNWPGRERAPLYLPNLPEQRMETSHFLQDVVMYLAAAVVAVSLSRRWGLGAVIGYLAAGVLIGPYALNLARDVEATSQLSEFGVILLLFVIGLELSPQRLWLMRRAVFGAGLAQVVLSGLLLGAAALAFGLGWKSALIVGLALIPLLGAQVATSETGDLANVLRIIGVMVAVAVGGRYLMRPVFRIVARTQIAEVFTATALLVVLGAAWIMEVAGIQMSLGAFVAG